MADSIHFGTSGWRAILGEEFTFFNVARALTGIAEYLHEHVAGPPEVVVGHDTRFLGERFAGFAAAQLQAMGVKAQLAAAAAPTPALAYYAVKNRLAGVINFTASHNPPEYNGLKFSTAAGAPAPPEITGAIEARIPGTAAAPSGDPPGSFVPADIRTPYLARLQELVRLDAIHAAGLKIGLDPLWGTARGYTHRLLEQANVPCVIVHDYRDVLFGGHAPEPEIQNTRELAQRMQAAGATLGLVTDGDADRFGILDETGELVQPNYVLALLLDYLIESRGWRHGAGKSVATTHLLNAVAEYHKIPLHETPVGFKYLGELIIKNQATLVGEESAGLTIFGHVPEKDGILAGLLIAEMVASRRAGVREQIAALFAKVGSFYPARENFRLTREQRSRLSQRLEDAPGQFAGHRVSEVIRTDGLKLLLDDGAWVLFRPSGTEPVVRIYVESRTLQEQAALQAAARKFLLDSA